MIRVLGAATLLAFAATAFAQTSGSTGASTGASGSASGTTEQSGASGNTTGGASGSMSTPSTGTSGSAGVGASGSTATPSTGVAVGAARCDALLGAEKERCIREEGAASGSTSAPVTTPAPAGDSTTGTSK